MEKKGILAFCNPIVDLLSFVEDEYLIENNLAKGKSVNLNEEQIKSAIKNLKISKKECGGSGINVARWIGLMDYRVSVIGQYGDDDMRKIVDKCLQDCGVENKCIVKKGGMTTMICICVTPDAQRTMFGIYAASHEKFVEHVDPKIVDEYSLLLIEGYQFLSPFTKEIVCNALKRIKEKDGIAALVISSVFMVPGYKESLLAEIDKFKIITGTFEEFSNLFDKQNIDDVLNFLEKSTHELCAVTMGEEGCYLVHKGKRIFVPAPEVENVVDTTGAGDSFTAGLLYGYLNEWTIDDCAKLGNFCAGYTISRLGVNFDENVKKQLKEYIHIKSV